MARNGVHSKNNFEIYVGNLLISANEKDLRNAFKEYSITTTRILSTGTKKYAFLQLDSEASVIKAVKEMNGYTLKGLQMVVRAGNARLHSNILNGSVRLDSSSGTVQPNDTDDGPPPLEAVYITNDDDDLPPPLEPAYLPGLAADDLPPPLEPVLPQAIKLKQIQRDNSPVTLVVANFPFKTNEEDLLSVFEEYMPLKASVIVNSRLNDSNEKTYAYVTLPDRELAEKAVTELDGTLLNRRQLIVTYLLERAFAH